MHMMLAAMRGFQHGLAKRLQIMLIGCFSAWLVKNLLWPRRLQLMHVMLAVMRSSFTWLGYG